MPFVYAFRTPNRTEIEPLRIIENELRTWKNLFILKNFKIEGRTRETDAVLLMPGLIVCIELKDWNGIIKIPSDMTDWFVNPPVRYPSPTVPNPIEQARNSEFSVKNFLRDGTCFDESKWYISSAVMLTHISKTVSFQSNNEDIQSRVFQIENFRDDLSRHMRKYHPNLRNRQSTIDSREISFVLARLGVPPGLNDEFINQINKDVEPIRQPNQRTPLNHTQENLPREQVRDATRISINNANPKGSSPGFAGVAVAV